MKFRNYRDGDEHQIVELLNQAYSHWGTIAEWQQKYAKNANFDPRLVFLAEDEGKIVGCVHYLQRDLNLNNRTLHAYVGGDGATRSGFSGKGVFSKGLNLLYEEVKKRKGGVVYGYNSETIYQDFYRKRFGEIAVYCPHVMVKILDFEKLISSITPVANRIMRRRIRVGKKEELAIRLILDNKTVVDICLTSHGIKLSSKLLKPDITIEARLRVLFYAFSDWRNILKALMFRKIRLRLSGSSVPKLVKLLLRGVGGQR